MNVLLYAARSTAAGLLIAAILNALFGKPEWAAADALAAIAIKKVWIEP